MRTTVRMNPDLLKEAKAYAAKIGMSLTLLIEEGVRLRLKLLRRGSSKKRKIRLAVFHGKGLKTKLNLSSNAEIEDFMSHL